jgi:hypothetical protein
MLHGCDGQILRNVEDKLRESCPSPEGDLIKLGEIASGLPETQMGARFRRLVLDLDDLIAQARWHLGQALLLAKLYPDALEPRGVEASEEGPGRQFVMRYGMPARVKLALRRYVAAPDRVLYEDLSRSRYGGTVAGWIFHMMIDSAIFRVVAALDRMAHLLWHAADLPSGARVYFRSGKMKAIHGKLRSPHSEQLLMIASRRLLRYVIEEYRDGLSHQFKAYSLIAGFPPVDEWDTDDGKRIVELPDQWDADLLLALGMEAYHQLVEALAPTVAICEERLVV